MLAALGVCAAALVISVGWALAERAAGKALTVAAKAEAAQAVAEERERRAAADIVRLTRANDALQEFARGQIATLAARGLPGASVDGVELLLAELGIVAAEGTDRDPRAGSAVPAPADLGPADRGGAGAAPSALPGGGAT